jgi:hypothetical protein
MQHDRMTLTIADLPLLDEEAALFDASLDPASLQISTDHIIISLVFNP